MEHELGFFVAGGKGRVSRRTPDEILARGNLLKTDPERLVYVSKMSAKVDSAAVQDGYQLYHHVLFFDREGKWAVVQQGMNEESRYAHGGKDGHPYPVDRENYDRSIHFLRETLNAAKIGETDRKRAFERLNAFAGDAGR